MRRWLRALVATAVVLVVVAPALRPSPRDGFPLSTYPMFASDRGREASVTTAVGVDPDGGVERLGPETIADSDEVMLAAATVRRAVAAGTDARLCVEIADRLPDSAVRSVEIRTETFDAVGYFDGDTEPLAVTLHHRCAVPNR